MRNYNDMTKQEKIKEAWGENWYNLNKRGQEQALEDNGYCHKNYINSEIYFEIESLPYPDNEFVRPESLQGIENNNGWIKIESEADLPKEDCLYWVILGGEMEIVENWEITLSFHNKKTITHYQPIEKPNPPIY